MINFIARKKRGIHLFFQPLIHFRVSEVAEYGQEEGNTWDIVFLRLCS